MYQHSITTCYMLYQGGRKIYLQGLDWALRMQLHLFIIPFTSTLNKKTVSTSNTLVTIYQISRCHTTEDRNINIFTAVNDSSLAILRFLCRIVDFRVHRISPRTQWSRIRKGAEEIYLSSNLFYIRYVLFEFMSIQCMIWFSLQTFSATFLLRRMRWDVLINVRMSSCKVPIIRFIF
jgi:hypothetical protein